MHFLESGSPRFDVEEMNCFKVWNFLGDFQKTGQRPRNGRTGVAAELQLLEAEQWPSTSRNPTCVRLII